MTIQRTGIVKRQIPLADLDRFLAPSANTVLMYGIEGNGEPTLYRDFDALVERLTDRGAAAYLITNGSRLTADHVVLLLRLESINFSLNAATADMHRKVMKLDGFDATTAFIRDLVKARGEKLHPHVSASFVVTNDNIHEAVDFLWFCDRTLGVDEILLRPLSELATESGTIEDLRDLVPFENDVRDMIQRVQAELAKSAIRAQVTFDPASFRSYRPVPTAATSAPDDAGKTEEFGIKLPHPGRWQVDSPEADISWPTPSKVTVAWFGAPGPYLLRSYTVPCARRRQVRIPVKINVISGVLGIGILDRTAQGFVSTVEFGEGRHETDLKFPTAENDQFQVVLYSNDAEPLNCSIDWGDAIDPPPEGRAVGADGAELRHPLTEFLSRIVFGQVRVRCQKPWTDLSSFSVDGRVDVCCIATGPSQEHYALGNFLSEDFQAIWNGERMKAFRRTVNTDSPLPPCARCPLAFAYQGPLFAPRAIQAGLRRRLPGAGNGGTLTARLAAAALVPVMAVVRAVFFRGFRW